MAQYKCSAVSFGRESLAEHLLQGGFGGPAVPWCMTNSTLPFLILPAATAASRASSMAVTRDRCVPLVGAGGAVLGMAVCPGTSSKPIYVSIGKKLQ